MTNETSLRVESGSVIALRLIDLGGPLDLDAVERASADAFRPRFPEDGSFEYARPPVEIELDEVEIRLGDGSVFADATARVFDFGVVAIALRVLVGGFEWDRFEDRVEQVEAALRSADAAPWQQVHDRLAGAVPGLRSADESARRDYTVVLVRRMNQHMTADSALDQLDVPLLVAGDRQPLSAIGRQDLLRGAYSYFADDLVVVGHDRAFLLDSEPGSGVPDAVEAALVQRFVHEGVNARLGAQSSRLFPEAGGGTVKRLPRSEERAARAAAMRAAETLRRADALVRTTGWGRLAGTHAVARDRLRAGEIEAHAHGRLAAVRGRFGDLSRGPDTGAFLIFLALVLAALVALVALM